MPNMGIIKRLSKAVLEVRVNPAVQLVDMVKEARNTRINSRMEAPVAQPRPQEQTPPPRTQDNLSMPINKTIRATQMQLKAPNRVELEAVSHLQGPLAVASNRPATLTETTSQTTLPRNRATATIRL